MANLFLHYNICECGLGRTSIAFSKQDKSLLLVFYFICFYFLPQGIRNPS